MQQNNIHLFIGFDDVFDTFRTLKRRFRSGRGWRGRWRRCGGCHAIGTGGGGGGGGGGGEGRRRSKLGLELLTVGTVFDDGLADAVGSLQIDSAGWSFRRLVLFGAAPHRERWGHRPRVGRCGLHSSRQDSRWRWCSG